MVTAIAPVAIFLGVAATVGLLFFSVWDRIARKSERHLKLFSTHLDRAGIAMRPEEIALGIAGSGAALWVVVALLLRPPFLVGLLLLPVCAGACVGGYVLYVRFKLQRRLNAFVQQLELALRLIAGGVRVGLGLRQALTVVIDEMPDPARHEYMRVVGQTNIGVSVYDALDDLSERMPSNETLMMARSIRIQSQTGGDLGKILDHLAETIKERRRIQRKISALTAEGRASAFVLSLLPVVLAVYICTTQRVMGHALIGTTIGHITLGVVAVLEALGVFVLLRILKVNV